MHTDAKRFYAVLEVAPTASDEAIRGAFRRRAKELHPDAETGNASAFILLKRAYDLLIDPDLRAAYDRACQPAPRPRPAETRRAQPFSAPPPPLPRSIPSRRGGVGIVRYVIAFLIMAAISLGGVQAMISLTGAPPSIQTRSSVGSASPEPAATPATETSTAPGSSKSGFWDATPAAPANKTP